MAIGHRIRKKLGNWRKLKRQKLENNVNVKKQPSEEQHLLAELNEMGDDIHAVFI